jgi:hypothetical protein
MASFVGDEPGNIENRRADRVAANFAVTFRELDDAEAERLGESMSALPELPVPVPAAPAAHSAKPGQGQAAAGHTENISQGGLSLTGDLQILGDRRLERGKKLLVEFRLPGDSLPVMAVAVVVWSIVGRGEHGKFTAGLMFTGVDAADLDKIQHYISGHAGG